MRAFTLVQDYPPPPSAVLEALLRPELDAFLVAHVPDLRVRERLSFQDDGTTVRARVRCVPRPNIPEVARHAVKPEMVSWVEETVTDRRAGTIAFHVVPTSFQEVFSFRGAMRLEPTATGGCRRTVRGELTIRIPWVGRYVEEYLVEEIRRNMEAEGVALARFLEQVGAHGGLEHPPRG